MAGERRIVPGGTHRRLLHVATIGGRSSSRGGRSSSRGGRSSSSVQATVALYRAKTVCSKSSVTTQAALAISDEPRVNDLDSRQAGSDEYGREQRTAPLVERERAAGVTASRTTGLTASSRPVPGMS